MIGERGQDRNRKMPALTHAGHAFLSAFPCAAPSGKLSL
jgi:hypothetical protein